MFVGIPAMTVKFTIKNPDFHSESDPELYLQYRLDCLKLRMGDLLRELQRGGCDNEETNEDKFKDESEGAEESDDEQTEFDVHFRIQDRDANLVCSNEHLDKKDLEALMKFCNEQE